MPQLILVAMILREGFYFFPAAAEEYRWGGHANGRRKTDQASVRRSHRAGGIAPAVRLNEGPWLFTTEQARERWDWDTMSGCPEVWDGEERLPGELFAGIGADHLHISYGGLYELLVRLGMAVEGTPEHFWVTGADGAEYEFSYDFHREAHSKEDETHIIWYFLRNGYMADTSHESAWYLSW